MIGEQLEAAQLLSLEGTQRGLESFGAHFAGRRIGRCRRGLLERRGVGSSFGALALLELGHADRRESS